MTSGTGTCSITATKAADNDFNSTTSAAFAVTINKAQPNCSSIAGYTATYDGSEYTATGSCKDVGGSALAGLDLSQTTHISAAT